MIPCDPAPSLFERCLRRRWEQFAVIDGQTARHPRGRRLVSVDGWSSEDWLARSARPGRDEDRAIRGEATPAVDPTLSAADLLALRTQLVAKGARDD